MDPSTPRIRSLLRQAERVAGAGKRAAAEQLYRQILEEASETAAAWAGLAKVTADADERERASRRAAQLDPQYQDGSGPLAAPVLNFEPDESDPVPEAAGGQQIEPAVEDGLGATAGHEYKDLAFTGDLHAHAATFEAVEGETLLYCANHPGRETNLRCNRCGKPICSSCARRTPVGYRCPECIREQEDVYYSARVLDYVLAVVVALPLALIAGFFAARIGFLVIFLSAIAGTLIGRVVFYAVGRRRGRWLPYIVTGAIIMGGVLPAIPLFLAILFGQPFGAIGLLWLAIYIAGASSAAYYQLK